MTPGLYLPNFPDANFWPWDTSQAGAAGSGSNFSWVIAGEPYFVPETAAKVLTVKDWLVTVEYAGILASLSYSEVVRSGTCKVIQNERPALGDLTYNTPGWETRADAIQRTNHYPDALDAGWSDPSRLIGFPFNPAADRNNPLMALKIVDIITPSAPHDGNVAINIELWGPSLPQADGIWELMLNASATATINSEDPFYEGAQDGYSLSNTVTYFDEELTRDGFSSHPERWTITIAPAGLYTG